MGAGQREAKEKKGGQYALDNLSHTVCPVASGSCYGSHLRRPYTRSSGHRRDRSDRSTVTGTENSLGGKRQNDLAEGPGLKTDMGTPRRPGADYPLSLFRSGLQIPENQTRKGISDPDGSLRKMAGKKLLRPGLP